ncbi:unnamed protein product [Rhizoctonia solani]|uniref:F-box domain-containing protein n=1 Tax=Rhizoctonia solani TaxID=456999 RepID=A0A8H3C9P2_9AGAM|nr:unnamed protein product [Rhizoctonia solani]CAE6511961.1 unnamed protein product [Rhizoctonia solani]
MPSTRASARLATRKGVAQEAETQQPPPRKVKRAKLTKGRRRKIRVSSKNRLDKFIGIPIDIFAEITSHLYPKDIISLSRANKYLRSLLMRRSSRHIWISAMNNIEGLPPCPPDISEPRYLALLFARDCTGCGQPIGARLYEELRVRFCISCRNTQLCTLKAMDLLIGNLVHNTSVVLKSPLAYARPIFYYAIQEEVDDVKEKLQEFGKAKDDQAFEVWLKKRKETIQRRRLEATSIHTFMEIWRYSSKARQRR